MVEFGSQNQSEKADVDSGHAQINQLRAVPTEWRRLCDDSLFESIFDAPAARYLNRKSVRELGLELARETFREFPIGQYKPDRDILQTVDIEGNSFLRAIGSNRSLIIDAIAAGKPIIIQSRIELSAIEDLGFLPHGSLKDQWEWMTTQVSAGQPKAFNAADLLLGVSLETRIGIFLKIPFESSIAGATPWAYAAQDAFKKVLFVAVAAAVLEKALPQPFQGEYALELFLKQGLGSISANPCAILQEPLVKRAQAVTALPRAELLVEMGEQAAIQALQRESYLKVFTRFIDEQQAKIEKRVVKEAALAELEEQLRQQATMPSDAYDAMVEDLASALRANAAYRNSLPEDVRAMTLDLVKDLLEVKDINARLDTACQWSRLIRGGTKKAQLPKRRK